jgi:hypothetical protein
VETDVSGNLTGDWNGFAKMLENAGRKFQTEVGKATNQNGLLVERAMVETITGQKMGGPGLSAKYLAWKLKHGLSEKKLIAESVLVNGIKYQPKDWKEGFVGVNRHEPRKNYDIGWIMEFGSRDGRVPARPYIDPSLARVADQCHKNWEDAVDRVFQ